MGRSGLGSGEQVSAAVSVSAVVHTYIHIYVCVYYSDPPRFLVVVGDYFDLRSNPWSCDFVCFVIWYVLLLYLGFTRVCFARSRMQRRNSCSGSDGQCGNSVLDIIALLHSFRYIYIYVILSWRCLHLASFVCGLRVLNEFLWTYLVRGRCLL